MREEVIIAGSGGQGVLLAGQILALAGMLAGKNVTWAPDYGPATRGGTAKCTVIISDEEIGSPLSEKPSCIIVMNQPSLNKFISLATENCTVVINGSLVPKNILDENEQVGQSAKLAWVDANTIATNIGNPRAANFVMIGAYIALTGVVQIEKTIEAIREWSRKNKREASLKKNEEALRTGFHLFFP